MNEAELDEAQAQLIAGWLAEEKRAMTALRAQRDSLLAALEEAQAFFLHGIPSHAPNYTEAMGRIDAAIAAAREPS